MTVDGQLSDINRTRPTDVEHARREASNFYSPL